jgi:putative nucleotidyltransferase with HDIG domain
LTTQILFVDDEQAILDGLRNVLRRFRKVWDMQFACGAQAALEVLRSKPIDIIVSDMRMPGMDGAALLQTVKDEFPSVVRMILSGYADRESIVRVLPVAHQFVSKPCDAVTLSNVIERAVKLRDLVADEGLRRLMGAIPQLPTPPRIYHELTQALGDPDVALGKVVGLVEQDPAVAAKLLQLVNSSYFGLGRSVSSLSDTVSILGFELVRSLLLTAHILVAMDGAHANPCFSFDELQACAFLTAKVARRIAPRSDLADPAFTAALLHDLGKMIVASAFPDRFEAIARNASSGGRLLHDAEREDLGYSHAEIGAYLLGLWGLPNPIVEAVAYHHAPAQVAQPSLDLIGVVHAADALVDECWPPISGLPAPDAKLDLDLLRSLGVADQLPAWRSIVDEELGKTRK